MILEEEFVWVRRLMNALTALGTHRRDDGHRLQHDTPRSVDTGFRKAS